MTTRTKEQEIARAVPSGGPAANGLTYATLPDGNRTAIHATTEPEPIAAIEKLGLNPSENLANMLSVRARRFLLAELRETLKETPYVHGQADMFDDLRMLAALERHAQNLNGHDMDRLITVIEATL